MDSQATLMSNLEVLGQRYCHNYLDCWQRTALENDWWQALQFFLSHSFMRGRRDELSTEYYRFTIEALGAYLSVADGGTEKAYSALLSQREYLGARSILKFKEDRGIDRRHNSIKDPRFAADVANANPIVRLLVGSRSIAVGFGGRTYSKVLRLSNDADVMMVLDTLEFISRAPRRNVYSYLLGIVKTEGLRPAYRDLTSIRQVSDKIASFIHLTGPRTDEPGNH